MARCKAEMISNSQPDHLLWSATRKVKHIHTVFQVDDFDSDQRKHNLKQNWSGGVCTIKKYWDRRRYLLHLRQLVGDRQWRWWDSARWHEPHQENGTVRIAGKKRLQTLLCGFLKVFDLLEIAFFFASDGGVEAERFTVRIPDALFLLLQHT